MLKKIRLPLVERLIEHGLVTDRTDARILQSALILEDYKIANEIMEMDGFKALEISGRKGVRERCQRTYEVEYFDAFGDVDAETLLRIDKKTWFIGTIARTTENLMIHG